MKQAHCVSGKHAMTSQPVVAAYCLTGTQLAVYSLMMQAHAHFSCCVGDVVIRLRGLVTPAGDMDSWTLLDNLGEICGTRWGCQRVLFASGEESYVMPDKVPPPHVASCQSHEGLDSKCRR